MAKQRSSIANFQQVQKMHSRPGEGSVIGFVTHNISNPDGTTAVALFLNMNTARVPDRRYVANVAAVQVVGEQLVLIFGQSKLGGSGYRSLLIIEMSSTYVHQFLKSSEDLVKGIVKFSAQHNVRMAKLCEIKEDVPGQTIPFVANIATAGFTGRDACMDFYYASPFSVQIAGMGGEFAAEPVVRVNLPTALMGAVYEQLDLLKDSLPREEQYEEAK